MVKIATWNVERPTANTKRRLDIEKQLASLNADILVLTETNECLNLGEGYKSYHTSPLPGTMYKPGERRSSIYSKYPATGELETFSKETAICIKFETSLGELAVYGTIIGIFGNREQSFKTDLELQLADFKRIAAQTNLCIAGDLNLSFGDNYYYTKEGRDKLNETFETLQLVNMTRDIPENIDHIILPQRFIREKVVMETWNTDKKMSDHIGVVITIV